MIVELWCQWSELDKQWRYQLFATGESGTYFLRWIWFYVGRYLASTKIHLFPYLFTWGEDNRRLGRWGETWDAKQIAKWIVAAIKKHEAEITGRALRKRMKGVK